MKSSSLKAVTEITRLAPQFLVDDLSEAIGYYRDRLGFEPDFVYESFYASVSRDGFSIHLKCAPKTVADRTHRKQNEHLDAYVGVRGIEALFDELKSKGAHIIRSLEERPWGCKDFYVELSSPTRQRRLAAAAAIAAIGDLHPVESTSAQSHWYPKRLG